MNTLQMIQQVAPAIAAFAVLGLPWATLAAMPLIEAASREPSDDKWHTRVGVALRWSSMMAQPKAARPPLALAA
jgi:hypothetical protein